MKKLYRLVSSNVLEIYNLKGSGELLFCKSVNPTEFNFRKIRHLIISACFTNWDTKRIENIAYKPNSKMNMFASQSIFEKDEVFITLPYKSSNTDYWTQAWAPKNKLSPFLKNISKKIILDLFDGIESDLKKTVRVTGKNNLLLYSYRVAGTVGLMMAKILKVKEKYSLIGAINLGVAMQLTNIARDVIEDKKNKRF